MEKLYVVKPGTNQLVAPEEWLKSEDPKSAEFLALMQDDGKALVFQKKFTDEEYKFDEAQKVAAKVKLAALPGVAFRCPTRKEFIDLYDSIKDGLIKILDSVGGKIFGPGQWFWTCEKVVPEIKEQWEDWFAQRCSVDNAWIFYGGSGYLYNHNVHNAYQVGAVTLCSVSAEGDTLILKPLGEGAPAPSRAAQAAKKEPPTKSGITGRAEVIFGGRIQLFVGWDDESNRGCIQLSELKRDGKAGDILPPNPPNLRPASHHGI